MGYKKYIGFSLVLIIAIAVYLNNLALGDYTVSAFSYSLTLPVLVWFILPVALLFIASLLHMFFYGFKHYLKDKAVARDEEEIFYFLESMILGKASGKVFRTKEFNDLAEVLSQLKFDIKSENFESKHKNLNVLAQKILDIKSGKYVNAKDLDDKSIWMEQNIVNKVNEDSDFCLEVVKKPENYPVDLVNKSFVNIISNKSMTTVKKYLPYMPKDKAVVLALFKRDSEEKDFNLSDEEIIKYLKDVNFDKNDFINMARAYKNEMQPDRLLNIFEELSNNNEFANEAYLYVLFEYEMIDKIRDILVNSSEHEYIPYKALLDLKDAGKHYTLDSLCIINS